MTTLRENARIVFVAYFTCVRLDSTMVPRHISVTTLQNLKLGLSLLGQMVMGSSEKMARGNLAGLLCRVSVDVEHFGCDRLFHAYHTTVQKRSP